MAKIFYRWTFALATKSQKTWREGMREDDRLSLFKWHHVHLNDEGGWPKGRRQHVAGIQSWSKKESKSVQIIETDWLDTLLIAVLHHCCIISPYLSIYVRLYWWLVTAMTTWYGEVMRCPLLTGNTTASNATRVNMIPKEEMSPTPLWSLSSCCSSAGCRSASAAGGWFPAAVRSSLWVGRCAADNPGLNPKGWNPHVETGGKKNNNKRKHI